MLLGLAAPPEERVPIESLGEEELVKQAIAEREERARKEKFKLVSTDPRRPWTDYTLTSAQSGKTYHLAIRGTENGESYCSCPDFRTNTLGTCKHLLYAIGRIKARFPARKRPPHRRRNFAVQLDYTGEVSLRLSPPAKPPTEGLTVAQSLLDKDITDVAGLVRRIAQLEQAGCPVTIYPDAREFIDQRLYQLRMEKLVAEIRSAPDRHPLRKSLLKTELLPYQMDGIAFAVGAGRAILADDMGLGKTIQGIGVAELLAQEAGIKKVLIICPTSLKTQWRNEVLKFSHRDCQLIVGSAPERAEQYDNEQFFTVCNYEQVLRDLQCHRDRQVGLDHFGRRPADQELGSQDNGRYEESQISVCSRAVRHAAGESPGRTVFRRAVHRRSTPRPGVSGSSTGIAWSTKMEVSGTRTSTSCGRRSLRFCCAEPVLRCYQQLPPRTTEIVRIPPTEEQSRSTTAI